MKCAVIRCDKEATLALILEVNSSTDVNMYHKPHSFLKRVGYCDYDFGFFYRALSQNYDLVRVDTLEPMV